jgi:hypothetical protein
MGAIEIEEVEEVTQSKKKEAKSKLKKQDLGSVKSIE